MTIMTRRLVSTINSTVSFAFISLLLSIQSAIGIELTTAPTIKMRENPGLVGTLHFGTDVPSRMSIRVQSSDEAWTVVSDASLTEHEVPLLGFQPNTRYNVFLEMADENGNRSTLGYPLQVHTDPLPTNFPSFEVRTNLRGKVEPGMTMAGISGRNEFPNYTVATDHEGNVRWYFDQYAPQIERQADGTFLSLIGSVATEFDVLGNITHSWHPGNSTPGPNGVKVASTNFHHDIQQLPNGNFLTLNRAVRTVTGFPTSDEIPNPPTGTAEVDTDPAIEFAPDGTVVRTFDLLDVLDPTRIGYDVLEDDGPHDWAHTNAAVYDPSDDSILISARHQDAVIKLSRATGELVWILGNHADWPSELEPYLLTPVGEDFEWQYHQHAPEVLPNGNILIHDNGNARAMPPEPQMAATDSYTRAVEYAINEETMEIEQVWEWGRNAEQRLFGPLVGDVDWMEQTDNISLTVGAPIYVDGVQQSNLSPRIIEIARDGTVVHDVAVVHEGAGAFLYRSEKIPTLYPPEYDWTLRDLADINDDGTLSSDDIERLTAEVQSGRQNAMFDLNIDGFVDDRDRHYWVNDLAKTYFGDSNLDGQFTTSDLTHVFGIGEYQDEIEGNSTWSDGDWNGDGEFDSQDFVLAFGAGGYEQPPNEAHAVPEPNCVWLLAFAFASAIRRSPERNG